jgi:CubicO group peptidase (beta-lactamase class C family)
MTNQNFITILLTILTFTVLAQTPSVKVSPPLSTSSPQSAGMSEERLLRIDAMLNAAVNNGDIPGGVALVARNGKIVYHKAFGYSDPEKEKNFEADDIFRIASQTKAITATAVMMLWEEGKFQLDDPISKYIPEFGKAQILDSLIERDTSFLVIPAEKQITIRHLLTHTSGIGYGMIDTDERFKKIYKKAGISEGLTINSLTTEENIKRLAKLPLHHNPGEKFTYGLGLDVLGYFIELMSGVQLDDFFRTRIFEPLGMNDTRFYLPESNKNRLVPVLEKVNGKWVKFNDAIHDPDYPIHGAKKLFSGGAGLSGTVIDYAAFLQMYLNNGEYNGQRLLSCTTIKTIMSEQVKEPWVNAIKYYGLAFSVLKEKGVIKGGEGSEGTFDWGGYFNTTYFADPEQQLIGILYKQTQGNAFADDTNWKFRLLVEQAVDDELENY